MKLLLFSLFYTACFALNGLNESTDDGQIGGVQFGPDSDMNREGADGPWDGYGSGYRPSGSGSGGRPPRPGGRPPRPGSYEYSREDSKEEKEHLTCYGQYSNWRCNLQCILTFYYTGGYCNKYKRCKCVRKFFNDEDYKSYGGDPLEPCQREKHEDSERDCGLRCALHRNYFAGYCNADNTCICLRVVDRKD